jgi:hypothetical protein
MCSMAGLTYWVVPLESRTLTTSEAFWTRYRKRSSLRPSARWACSNWLVTQPRVSPAATHTGTAYSTETMAQAGWSPIASGAR